MMGPRWNSWGATSPLWGCGLVLIAVGLVLIGTAYRQVRHGHR